MKIRRKFIIDSVEYYKKNNADDYAKFLDIIEHRRGELHDKKHGKVKGATEMRLALSIPQKLMQSITYVLNGVSEAKFLEDEGEMEWFCKKFPQFLIPSSL